MAGNNVVTIGSKQHGTIEKAEQIGYSGPDLVPGSYIVKTGGTWLLKTNSSGDEMISIPLNVAEPKGSKKAKYNGATVWHTMNLTEQGAPYNNAFLEACEIDPKKFHGAPAQTEPGNGFKKITKVKGVEIEGHMLSVAIGHDRTGKYLNVKAYGTYDPDSAVTDDDEAEDEAPWDEPETGSDDGDDDDF